jgi:hypothetical protein
MSAHRQQAIEVIASHIKIGIPAMLEIAIACEDWKAAALLITLQHPNDPLANLLADVIL